MENKGCLISIAIYVAVLSVIAVIGYSVSVWDKHNPVKYCDEIKDVENVVVCKMRYPILNSYEVKKVIDENKKLKEEVSSLKTKVNSIRDVINEQEPEITGEELPQIDF